MALPIQVAAGVTLGSMGSARVGPFFVNGNVYVLGLSSTGIRCFKSASPTTGFVAQNTAGELTVGGSARNIAAATYGGQIHVAILGALNLYYRVFDCATDTWITNELVVANSITSITDLVVRSTGEVLLCYMSASSNMIVRRRTGVATWASIVAKSNDAVAAGLAVGAGDRVHIFYTSSTGFLCQKTLTAANVLLAEQAIGPGAGGSSTRFGGRPSSYANAGVTRLMAAWLTVVGGNPSVAVADSADAPAWTTDAAALDSGVSGASSPPIACVTNDTNEYVAYVAASSVAVRDAERAKGGAFGVDTTDEAATVGAVSAASYFDGTNWKLGFVYVVAGNLRYTERTITGPSFGVSVPVGQATEVDTALALAEAKAKALGLATSIETAMPITAHKVAPLGVTTETGVALAIAPGRSVALGMATEACEAFAIASAKRKTIGLLIEEGLARQIGATKAREVGLVAEQDLATAVDSLKAAPLGLVPEVQVAFGLARLKAFALGLATEADLAFSIVTIPSIPNRPVTSYAIGDSVANPETSTPSMTLAGFADRASDGGAILEDHP